MAAETAHALRLAPSDLAAPPTGAFEGRELELGGRVLRRTGAGCVLADFAAGLEVELPGASAVEPGDLLVVRGELGQGRFSAREIVKHVRCPSPRGDGDFAWLSWAGVGRRLQLRARALACVREFFAERGFVEVDPPGRVPAPGVDLHLDAIATEQGYLVTSPELQMKRLLAGGMPRIYTLGHVSRRGELGPLHEPEFSLLEWYRAFSDLEAVLADTEALVSAVAESLSGACELTAPDGRRIDCRPPFERISVREAFRRYAGVADAAELCASDEGRYFELLVGAVEPALGRLDRPIFLERYPAPQAALAQLCADDPSVAERFELYVGGVELCNGFGELTDAEQQRQRFEADRALRQAQGRPVYPIDERFLDALAAGMPPAGGNALGFDRLLMLAAGAARLQDVLPFPASRL